MMEFLEHVGTDVENIIKKYIFRNCECCYCPTKTKIKGNFILACGIVRTGVYVQSWTWCCCGCITDNIIIQYKNGSEVHMG